MKVVSRVYNLVGRCSVMRVDGLLLWERGWRTIVTHYYRCTRRACHLVLPLYYVYANLNCGLYVGCSVLVVVCVSVVVADVVLVVVYSIRRIRQHS